MFVSDALGFDGLGMALPLTGERPTQPRLLEEVREHDRYQVEIKHHYPLTPGRRLFYEVDTYVFIPSTLGIDEDSYPTKEFYRRVQNYTRLSVAPLSLAEVGRGDTAPLSIVESAFAREEMSDAGVISSLKWLCVAFRKALGQQAALRGTSKKRGVAAIRELIAESEAVLDRHRALRKAAASRSEELREAYQMTAERMSLLAGDALLRAYDFARRRLPEHAVIDELTAAIERENRQRRKLNPLLMLSPDGGNEEFLARDSYLKKYASSVLYLDSDRRKEGATLEHIIYAIAAGVAMIFATAVTFYSQRAYGAFTLPVFCALVLGYMFKDRIKEIGRNHLGQFVRARVSDRRTEIRVSECHKSLGYIRETVRYVPRSKAPAEILAARRDGNDAVDEVVLRYSKQVVLHAHALSELESLGADIRGITDIMRHDVRPYLHHMDDPIETRLCWSDGGLRQARCQKNYFVELVSAHQRPGAKSTPDVHSTTLVLNRKGIRRVE